MATPATSKDELSPSDRDELIARRVKDSLEAKLKDLVEPEVKKQVERQIYEEDFARRFKGTMRELVAAHVRESGVMKQIAHDVEAELKLQIAQGTERRLNSMEQDVKRLQTLQDAFQFSIGQRVDRAIDLAALSTLDLRQVR